jgi:hypothetical protein
MNDEQKDIIKWIDERIEFIDTIYEEALKDGNYGKQVYLSAKKEAFEELKLQLTQKAKRAG